MLQGPKKQEPNYFGPEQSKAFGHKATVTAPLRIGFAEPLTNLLFLAPIAVPHSSFLVLCSLLLQHPPPLFLQLLFVNQRHFCSFLISYLFV